jgi:hypothetical protein
LADVLILLAAAILTLGASVAVALIARTAGRRRRRAERERPARLRAELDGIDDYIRRLGQAATDDDLDRLERENDKRGNA